MGTSSSQPHALTDQVERVLAAIRPSIQADGGDLELVEITHDGQVRIRFLGACIECPSADMTLKAGIEQNLKAIVPEVTSVVAVN
jgi:Fe-S cluster biogenesis protein NfuA